MAVVGLWLKIYMCVNCLFAAFMPVVFHPSALITLSFVLCETVAAQNKSMPPPPPPEQTSIAPMCGAIGLRCFHVMLLLHCRKEFFNEIACLRQGHQKCQCTNLDLSNKRAECIAC